ncbi:hypothetical protein F4803DRAFT_518269 [Xylaria telfairii]|nr:hypothetical protein F4803DRAFT_518269 [Xylaria telfairii]
MSRRDQARGASRWYRGASSSKIPLQNVNTGMFEHCMRDTPMEATPFTPARSSYDPSAPTSTRKVSASFSTDCPLSGHPTIAYSAVTASIKMNHPGPLTSHPINQCSASSSPRRHQNMDGFTTDRALKTSHTYSNLPMPATQYRAHSPKPSMTTTHISARTLFGRNEENIPPSLSMANLTTTTQSPCKYPTPKLVPKLPSPKKKVRARPGIPRSRTFNVLSNLTASLSRASLGQFTGSDSRRTSTSSKSTLRKDNTPYMNPQSASSNSSQALLNPAVETINLHHIYTAQSSAYWAGRFMALHDRFQSETLIPENLAMLVHAHAEHSLIPVAQPSLASSATTSCIPSPAKPMDSTTTSMSPRKSRKPSTKLQHKSGADAAAARISQSTTFVAPTQQSFEAAAVLLVDEDARTRRVFSHLNTLCATSEARRSLQSWQQDYARRMGKEHRKLFPFRPSGIASHPTLSLFL